MSEYTLPPPDAAAYQAKSTAPPPPPAADPPPAASAPPAAAEPPRDDMQLSPFLRGEPEDPRLSQAIKGFQQILQEPLPLAEKLNKLTEQLTRACEPYNRKGDDRTLSALTGAASEAVEQAVRQAIKTIQGAPEVSGPDKDQRLQQLHKQLEGLEWLPRGYQSSLQLDVNFARRDVKAGK